MSGPDIIKILLQNRTIGCVRCGRLDMYTTETVDDARDIMEGDGWEIRRFIDDYDAEGVCPDCREAVE